MHQHQPMSLSSRNTWVQPCPRWFTQLQWRGYPSGRQLRPCSRPRLKLLLLEEEVVALLGRMP